MNWKWGFLVSIPIIWRKKTVTLPFTIKSFWMSKYGTKFIMPGSVIFLILKIYLLVYVIMPEHIGRIGPWKYKIIVIVNRSCRFFKFVNTRLSQILIHYLFWLLRAAFVHCIGALLLISVIGSLCIKYSFNGRSFIIIHLLQIKFWLSTKCSKVIHLKVLRHLFCKLITQK